MMHYVSSISWRNLPDSGTVIAFPELKRVVVAFGLDNQLFPVMACASSLASSFCSTDTHERFLNLENDTNILTLRR
jgi:hypothetical protein